MYARLVELEKKAAEGGYAIPFLLGNDLEMAYGAIKAAEKLNSPIGLGVAPGVFTELPMEYVFPMLIGVARQAKVPVAVHLDHGQSYEQIEKAIQCGVNSVMFDGSYLDYQENVRRTKAVCEMAHAHGACLEAELGLVGGSAVRVKDSVLTSIDTDPEAVLDFIDQTGVDALAISFGNVHGIYQGEAKLNLDLVKKIVSMTDVPLVMHGGSGLAGEVYPKIVEAGICNIHFYSAVVKDIWRYLQNKVEKEESYPIYHELSSYITDYFQKSTEGIIHLLGSVQKG